MKEFVVKYYRGNLPICKADKFSRIILKGEAYAHR